MKLHKYKHLFSFGLLFFLTVGVYVWFAYSPYYTSFVTWSETNIVIYYFSIIVAKIIGIVWPPLPGAVFTVGSIWIIGWLPAYIADFIGSMIGSSIAYYIAYRWGYPIMSKILDESTIAKIKKVKVKKGRELEAVFLFRLSGGTLVEIVVYAAGVLKVPYKHFLVGSMFSHALIGVPTFYFFDSLSGSGQIGLNLVLLSVAVGLFIFLRTRYFGKS